MFVILPTRVACKAYLEAKQSFSKLLLLNDVRRDLLTLDDVYRDNMGPASLITLLPIRQEIAFLRLYCCKPTKQVSVREHRFCYCDCGLR